MLLTVHQLPFDMVHLQALLFSIMPVLWIAHEKKIKKNPKIVHTPSYNDRHPPQKARDPSGTAKTHK